jgi:hypothetical protein
VTSGLYIGKYRPPLPLRGGGGGEKISADVIWEKYEKWKRGEKCKRKRKKGEKKKKGEMKCKIG